MQETTLGALIDLALEMEKKAYAFYDSLEKRFSDRAEFVVCVQEVKRDELLHQRVLKEIRDSLSEGRLSVPVDAEPAERLQAVLDFLKDVDVNAFKDAEDVSQAIQTLESVEFDVVLSFVNIDEIDYEFTREYLQNESVAHTDRVFRAQECFD